MVRGTSPGVVRGPDTERHGQGEGDDLAVDEEEDRARQSLLDRRRERLTVLVEGVPEIARQHVGGPRPVLAEDVLVEAAFLDALVDAVDVGARAERRHAWPRLRRQAEFDEDLLLLGIGAGLAEQDAREERHQHDDEQRPTESLDREPPPGDVDDPRDQRGDEDEDDDERHGDPRDGGRHRSDVDGREWRRPCRRRYSLTDR